MSYWVYENYPTNRALVHEGNCRFCNEGRGARGRGRSTANGQWHGPFLNLEAAIVHANRTGRDFAGECQRCCPPRFSLN